MTETTKYFLNGRELSATEAWDYLAVKIPIYRPRWKRWLSWLIPSFRQRYILIGPRVEGER